MDIRWFSVVVAASALAALSSSNRTPPSRALLGRGLTAEFTPLEDRVGKDPKDLQALETLANRYLEHSAPGLAQAALDRAPSELKKEPRIADARARSLSALGHVKVALNVQRSMLAECAERTCPSTLLARAMRRERVLAQLTRLGIEDPRDEPQAALVAYRLSVREVRLDVR